MDVERAFWVGARSVAWALEAAFLVASAKEMWRGRVLGEHCSQKFSKFLCDTGIGTRQTG